MDTNQKLQYYPHDIKSYKNILRQWVSWLARCKHPQHVDHLQHVPYAVIYIRISRIQRWVNYALRTPSRRTKLIFVLLGILYRTLARKRFKLITRAIHSRWGASHDQVLARYYYSSTENKSFLVFLRFLMFLRLI